MQYTEQPTPPALQLHAYLRLLSFLGLVFADACDWERSRRERGAHGRRRTGRAHDGRTELVCRKHSQHPLLENFIRPHCQCVARAS